MAIGERIHHFRLLRGFTQKYLGQQLGFSESQADVRIAQYEKGARSPKENYLNALADIFDVSPHALAVPDIDSYVGLMHTLFTLEDLYGLHIGEIDGELCLRLDKSKGTTYLSMFDMFHAPEIIAFKYGGNISILGYITNIISAEDAPPQTNDFAGFYSTINQIMLNLFKEKDKIYILHPIALFY